MFDQPDRMELAETFADIARTLLDGESLEGTLSRIVTSAVAVVPGCDHAGVSVVERRRITTRGSSDGVPPRVDSIQYETDEGPCLDAIRDHKTIQVDDLRREARWPSFAQRAAEETGVLSILSFQLFAEEDTLGALNLYSKVDSAFDADARSIGAVLAAHAAVAMSSSQHTANLRTAIDSRDIIGQAKGILMAQGGISADDAFAALREASQRLQMKVSDVAQQVTYTGELPHEPDR